MMKGIKIKYIWYLIISTIVGGASFAPMMYAYIYDNHFFFHGKHYLLLETSLSFSIAAFCAILMCTFFAFPGIVFGKEMTEFMDEYNTAPSMYNTKGGLFTKGTPLVLVLAVIFMIIMIALSIALSKYTIMLFY